MTSKTKRALLAMFFIVAVDILGFTIVLPILPFYAEHYGASAQIVGLLGTVFAICQLISGPFLGRLSDSWGRKPVLIISQLGTLIGFIVLARSHALWLIFVSRIVDGITAGNLPIAQAVISDVTEPEHRTKAYGVIGVAFGLGFFIGPGLCAYLTHFGFSAPAWAAAGLSLTSIVLTTIWLPNVRDHHFPVAPATAPIETVPDKSLRWDRMTAYFRRPGIGTLLFQFLFFGLAFSSLISGFALFAERRLTYQGHAFGAHEVGYFYTYAGVLGLIIQGSLIGPMVKKWGERRLVAIGFLAQAVGYSALAIVYGIPALAFVTVFSSLGSGILRPALTGLLTRCAARHEQGAVLGASQSLTGIAQVLAPLLAGFLIHHHWLSAWALTAGGFAWVGLYFSRALLQSRAFDAA